MCQTITPQCNAKKVLAYTAVTRISDTSVQDRKLKYLRKMAIAVFTGVKVLSPNIYAFHFFKLIIGLYTVLLPSWLRGKMGYITTFVNVLKNSLCSQYNLNFISSVIYCKKVVFVATRILY